MTVSFIVRLPGKAETQTQLRAMLFDIVEAMRHEPEFVSTWVHEDQNEPNTLVLYETWTGTREAFLATQLSKPYRQAYEAALPALLAGERSITFLTGLKAYPQRRIQ